MIMTGQFPACVRHRRFAVLGALLAGWLGTGPAGASVAPLEEALSFARVATAAGPRVIGVTAYDAETIRGVDLSGALERAVEDPLTLYAALGHEALERVMAQAGAPASYPRSAVLMPLQLGARHIAVGTNYPAHADESDVRDGPFLFPKHVVPSAPLGTVSAEGRLLDYEVELCFVSLAAVAPQDPPARWGLILCNDFTDRASLLRHIDPADVTSGRGFTTGKSFPGALPVGDLFVIPRDPRAFAAGLELRLYRGEELRQQSGVSRAIWDIDEVLRRSGAAAGRRWAHAGRQVGLLAPDGTLPARSLVLSGTPDGTIFAGIAWTQKLRGLLRWLWGGWEQSLPRQVIETYIDDARRSGDYLRAGETVTIRVDRMGALRTRIVATELDRQAAVVRAP